MKEHSIHVNGPEFVDYKKDEDYERKPLRTRSLVKKIIRAPFYILAVCLYVVVQVLFICALAPVVIIAAPIEYGAHGKLPKDGLTLMVAEMAWLPNWTGGGVW